MHTSSQARANSGPQELVLQASLVPALAPPPPRTVSPGPFGQGENFAEDFVVLWRLPEGGTRNEAKVWGSVKEQHEKSRRTKKIHVELRDIVLEIRFVK